MPCWCGVDSTRCGTHRWLPLRCTGPFQGYGWQTPPGLCLSDSNTSKVGSSHRTLVHYTPSKTPLTAWFCQDHHFFGQVTVLLWLHFCVCVCPLVHPLCLSVPQTARTTQHHSVRTSNGIPSSRATCLVQCFTQVRDMVFMTRHNWHNQQHNSTRPWKRSSSMKSFSEDNTFWPPTLGGAMMEDLFLSHTCTSTSCSHGSINPLKQQKSVDTSRVLFTPHGRTVGVFHCDDINETLRSGECGTGSVQ